MTPEVKAAKVKELREAFLADELPKYMTYFSNELKATGAFIAGPTMTIADCQLFAQLTYFERGVADHVPKTCLEPYPEVTAYLARVKAIPAIKAFYKL
jgi:glutathione S-transferase